MSNGAAGFQFVGDMLELGMGQNRDRKNRRLRAEEFAFARQQWHQQMNESVQRRVADARAAGVHPLFALGASVGGSPTITASATPAPQHRSAGGAMSSAMRGLGEMLARATIKKTEAEAALADSKTATIAQRLAAQGHDTLQTTTYPSGGAVTSFPGGDFKDGPVMGPPEFYNPPVPVSKAVGVAAGNRPGFIDIQMPDGRTVRNYDPELGLDEIGQLNYAIQRSKHYVADALMKARPYVSDAAIIGFLKKLLPKGTRGNTNPPGASHRTRQKRRNSASTRRRK